MDETTKYDKSRGSFYDRGKADSYYRRRPNPHKMTAPDFKRVAASTPEEHAAYHAGYNFNEHLGNFKDYGD